MPLNLSDAAVLVASVEDRAARLKRGKDGGYVFLVERTNDVPAVLSLKLEFAKSYTKAPGYNSVSFKPPLAAVSKWLIRVPESEVKIEVRPLIAATDAPEAGPSETRLLAFLGPAATVNIGWTAKAEGAKGLEALVNLSVEQQVSIEEGIVRTRAQLAYEITRAELSQLEVELPSEEKIINVSDPNVREWSVKQGAVQLLTVQLFQPVRGKQNLLLEFERLAPPNPLVVPCIQGGNVVRQHGFIVVRNAAGLRAEAVAREGVVQIDPEDLPAQLRNRKWDSAHRYVTAPYTLKLNVERVEPRILADSFVDVYLRPEELQLRLVTVFEIQKAGVFQLDLQLPAGFDLRSVKGIGGKDVAPLEVDRHFVDAAAGNRLFVSLGRKAQGRVGLAVELIRTLSEPDLLSPTGRTVLFDLALPTVRGGAFVEREQGRLVVYAPESLRTDARVRTGLRPITYAEAGGGKPGPAQPAEKERPCLSFAYSEPPIALQLAVERRPPHLTARQLLVVRVEPGVVKYDAAFFYDILYSSVKFLHLDLPKSLASEVRITTPRIRYATLEVRPTIWRPAMYRGASRAKRNSWARCGSISTGKKSWKE